MGAHQHQRHCSAKQASTGESVEDGNGSSPNNKTDGHRQLRNCGLACNIISLSCTVNKTITIVHDLLASDLVLLVICQS